jgi:hypothetical protein
MSLLRISLVCAAVLLPQQVSAQTKAAADRAWPSFFVAFRSAVRKKDRVALRKMMVSDFYFSGGGGDDNNDGDWRDDAFEFWDDPLNRGWEALDKTLRWGSVAAARWWADGGKPKYPGRVSPPAANVKRNVDRASFDWLAFFEFRDGR